MILSDEEVLKRLNSPSNLMNRLEELSRSSPSKTAMDIFFKKKPAPPKFDLINPPPNETKPQAADTDDENLTLDKIIHNPDAQIELGLAHNNAIKLLNNSIDQLSAKLDDVTPSRLPAAMVAASKVIESIRKERNEAFKNNKDREVHYHFYTPSQRKVEEYAVIDVK